MGTHARVNGCAPRSVQRPHTPPDAESAQYLIATNVRFGSTQEGSIRMTAKPISILSTATSIASYVKKNARQVKTAQRPHHKMTENVREADHHGHHIIVRTRYEIEVDGRMLRGHMGVTNDGTVHYHPAPNMAFASAIDMVKHLIEIFPDDFAATRKRTMRGMKSKKPKVGHAHN